MRKRILAVLICIIGLTLISLGLNVNSKPSYTQNHDACHDKNGYTIESNLGEIYITVEQNYTITFNVIATGSNLFIYAPNETTEVMHNGLFTINPTMNRILDNSVYDLNLLINRMNVSFTIRTPNVAGFYFLFILAGDNSKIKPSFDYISVGFGVGGVNTPKAKVIDYIEIFWGISISFFILTGLSFFSIYYLRRDKRFMKKSARSIFRR